MKKYIVKDIPELKVPYVTKFVCTHDIQEGDEFIYMGCPEKIQIAKEVIPVFDSNLTNVYPYGSDKLGYTNTEVYKIIGRVSYDAHKWVKDGAKFGEKDVQIERIQEDKKTKYLETGDKVKLSIKGEFFDIIGIVDSIAYHPEMSGDAWGWDDEFNLINCEQGYWDENEEIKIKPIGNQYVRRKDLRFYGDYYLEFKLKCSKCKIFH